MKLKENDTAKKVVRINLNKINDQLSEVSDGDSIAFSKWLFTKSVYYKQQQLRRGLGDIPKSINRGDIVRVELGINVGDELSDLNKDGHFCLVWARKGFNVIIIPLTSTPQIGNEFSVNLGKIEGLPEDVDSYAKLEQIKSISIRRIKRLKEVESGKLSIADQPKLLEKVSQKFEEQFLYNIIIPQVLSKESNNDV